MSANSSTIEVVKLTPPPLPTKENTFGFNYGIRPYRKGGIRLESQTFRNKIFYHNYGHGGAGVSLAYGCAKHIVEQFLKDVAPASSKEVAVIGSGYMGLMEANLLADYGFKVTVYSKAFPKDLGVYDGEPCITSQVAGGLWMPFGLDIKDKPLHFQLGKTTFNYYKECIENKKYKALSYKPKYIIGGDNPTEAACEPGLVQFKPVLVDFGNGKLHEATQMLTIMMDGDSFLKELFEEAKGKGVRFERKEFEDILDLCELKEKYIFNCTGGHSRVLFNDTNIVPIVGHLLYLKKTEGCDYFLATTTKDGQMKVTMYPQLNKIAVGLSYEERGWLDKPDPEVVKKLAENLYEFLEWRAGHPRPKL